MLPSIFRRYFAYTGELKCRHCGSSSVRISKSLDKRSPFHIYRCSACGRHFKAGLKQDKVLGYVIGIVFVLILLTMLGSIIYHGFADTEELEPGMTIDVPAQLP
ncbi:MAG: hypothetical protein AB1421_00040 [Pseudomonadota bacterium]